MPRISAAGAARDSRPAPRAGRSTAPAAMRRSSADEPLEIEGVRRPDMRHQVRDEHSEARDDDQQVEQDDYLDQQRHARNQYLRAEKDAVFEHQQPQDLADRLMTH